MEGEVIKVRVRVRKSGKARSKERREEFREGKRGKGLKGDGGLKRERDIKNSR